MRKKNTLNIVVYKFGGKSLSAPHGLETLISVVSDAVSRGESPLIVVSALENITNRLIELTALASAGEQSHLNGLLEVAESHRRLLASNPLEDARLEAGEALDTLLGELRNTLQGVCLVKDISPRTIDLILSYGELLSAQVVYSFLRQKFTSLRHLDARQVIVTDSVFGSAHVQLTETIQAIRANKPQAGEVMLVSGFIAKSQSGEVTTIGRGGSDYTAALFASALSASEIQFWTTVDGIMTADPSRVKKAFTIPRLSYEEAMELSHFGAKVIDPRAMQPAMDKLIPIRIKNSISPEHPGSLISTESSPPHYDVTGISTIPKVSILRLQGSGLLGVAGTAKRMFEALWRESISVTLITQASSEHSICIALSPENASRAARAIDGEFTLERKNGSVESVLVEHGYSIVAVVGENMRRKPGISGRLFQALGKNGINVAAIAQGSSELNISVVISAENEAKTLSALHDSFFLSESKTVSLFLVGAGQVGSRLLEQISEHSEHLRKRQLELSLVGIANSKKMLFNPEGISLPQWKRSLFEEGEQMQVSDFVAKMERLNLPNSIFVDCSSAESVAQAYKDVLNQSVSIVTPNKKANSGSYAQYTELKNRAARANVKFYYETNVGAGLPIISTLEDLLSSGDEIIKIEAVLSGTLSYIFNTFAPGRPFSSVVKEAKELGYTEPDPRDDLSGTDVARKLLILAREIGMGLEISDISVERLYPEAAAQSESVEDFFLALSSSDQELEEKAAQAASRNCKLRYIALLEAQKAQVSLQEVGPEHPFYNMSGSDNIISFTTNRYRTRPLVVKGPGAGVDVTAAGVFADIIRCASYLS